jgi:hypothetical protein
MDKLVRPTQDFHTLQLFFKQESKWVIGHKPSLFLDSLELLLHQQVLPALKVKKVSSQLLMLKNPKISLILELT